MQKTNAQFGKSTQNTPEAADSESLASGGTALRRRMEIFGILVMAVSSLLILSIVTYTEADDSIIRSSGLGELASQDSPSSVRIRNGLGPLGAYIAYYLVPTTFGYLSVAFPGLMFVYGWRLFRKKPRKALHKTGLLLVPLIAFFSTLAGWFHYVAGWFPFSWAGTLGTSAAAGLAAVLSGLGAGILLFTFLAILLLFVIDLNMAELSRRFYNWRMSVQTELAAWLEKRKYGLNDELQPEKETAYADNTDEDPLSENKPVDQPAQEEEATAGPLTEPLPEEDEPETGPLNTTESEEETAPADAEEEQPPEPEVKKQKERPADEFSQWFTESDEPEPEPAPEPGPEPEAHHPASESEDEEKAKTPEAELTETEEPSQEWPEEPEEEEASPSEKLPLKLSTEEEQSDSRPYAMKPEEKTEAEGQKKYITINEMFGAPPAKDKDEERPLSEATGEEEPVKQAETADGVYNFPAYDLLNAPSSSENLPPRMRVSMRSLLQSRELKSSEARLPLVLGRFYEEDSVDSISDRNCLLDLAHSPHFLMAGAVGSGLNDGLHAIITSLLYNVDSEEVRLLLMDPLKERLNDYAIIKEHYLALPYEASAAEIASGVEHSLQALSSLHEELKLREEKMKSAMADDIIMYNRSLGGIRTGKINETKPMPHIVAIISEFAPLAINAGEQIQTLLNRIMPTAKEAGIHLILATRRPSPRVLPKSITSLFSCRLAYRLPMALDSRLIIDSAAACHIHGTGDFLLSMPSEWEQLQYVQQAYISSEEVKKVAAFIAKQAGAPGPYRLPKATRILQKGATPGDQDELLPRAARIALPRRSITASLLQRRLNVTFKRAERLLDQLYKAGIVGPWQEGGQRSVIASVRHEDEIRKRLAKADLDD